MYSNEKETCEVGQVGQQKPVQHEMEQVFCNLEICEKLQADLISRLDIVLNQNSCTENLEPGDSRVEIPIPLCSDLRKMSDRIDAMNDAFNDTLGRLGI